MITSDTIIFWLPFLGGLLMNSAFLIRFYSCITSSKVVEQLFLFYILFGISNAHDIATLLIWNMLVSVCWPILKLSYHAQVRKSYHPWKWWNIFIIRQILLWKHIFFISKSVLYLRFWLCNKLLHFGIYMICIYMLKHFI